MLVSISAVSLSGLFEVRQLDRLHWPLLSELGAQERSRLVTRDLLCTSCNDNV